MSNLTDVKESMAGTVANNRGGKATINQAWDFVVPYLKAAADAMASTTTADTVVWTNPFDFPVYLMSGRAVGVGAGLTAHDTNYATITFKTNDGAGGATAVALTFETKLTGGTGTWTSNQNVANSGRTAANAKVPANGQVWLNIAKAGSGVIVPVSNYHLRVQREE